MEHVDWFRLGSAVEFYKERGYEYIEAPWLVSREPYDCTKPPDAPDVDILGKYFVASGEQSFLELMLSGKEFKKAVCCTPCFRVEPPQDYHFLYFMKVELIMQGSSQEDMWQVITDAAEFFYTRCGIPCEAVNMGDGTYDLVGYNSKIELGSYGIRTLGKHSWIYGTGLAEPRASQVKQKELAAL